VCNRDLSIVDLDESVLRMVLRGKSIDGFTWLAHIDEFYSPRLRLPLGRDRALFSKLYSLYNIFINRVDPIIMNK